MIPYKRLSQDQHSQNIFQYGGGRELRDPILDGDAIAVVGHGETERTLYIGGTAASIIVMP